MKKKNQFMKKVLPFNFCYIFFVFYYAFVFLYFFPLLFFFFLGSLVESWEAWRGYEYLPQVFLRIHSNICCALLFHGPLKKIIKKKKKKKVRRKVVQPIKTLSFKFSTFSLFLIWFFYPKVTFDMLPNNLKK